MVRVVTPRGQTMASLPNPNRALTPEEESIDDADDGDDAVDDTLPSDLWFRRDAPSARPTRRRSRSDAAASGR